MRMPCMWLPEGEVCQDGWGRRYLGRDNGHGEVLEEERIFGQVSKRGECEYGSVIDSIDSN